MENNHITDFHFDTSIAQQYHSQRQKIRVMSETWVGENLYCPCCGNPHISKMVNNKPVRDFICDYCGEAFELKSKAGTFGKKIADGAYKTMIESISSFSNPHLFILSYTKDLLVRDMFFIPKFFFIPDIIEKRSPLPETAVRAGWTGCNILISNVPQQGKITLIQEQLERNHGLVVEEYNQIKKLQISSLETRGWLFDVLNCVNATKGEYFELGDIYKFVPELKEKHQNNHNIEAKIRQQLQLLRDRGIIEFLGKGAYRKIIF